MRTNNTGGGALLGDHRHSTRHRTLVWAIVFALVAALLSMVGSTRKAEAQALVPADIVFAIDESGSMGPYITAVKANVAFIASELAAGGLDAQLGLLGYGTYNGSLGHGTEATNGDPHIHTSPALTNEAGFATALNALVANGGIEPGFDTTVLGMSNSMGFRQGAGVCMVLITDEPSNGDTATQQDAIDALNGRDATFYGIIGSGPTSANQYGPNVGSLAEQTGGGVFPISNFNTPESAEIVLEALLEGCIGSIVEGINLLPATDENPTGTNHTVTAVVKDNLNNPVVGTEVTFVVTSGPNAGDTGMASTDANGEATFTYTGDGGAGLDVIEASFVDNEQQTQTAVAEKLWIASQATINIVKLVDSEPDGVFDNDAAGWTFKIKQAGQGLVDSGVTASDGLLTFTVDSGEGYSVRETAGPAGLWWASYSCADDDSGASLGQGNGMFPPARGAGGIVLVSDQSITCTFTNQLMAGFMTGGGQIIDDDDGAIKKQKDLEKISFGGNVGAMFDGTLHGQWQANFHNVSDDDLDKGKFHSTSIDYVRFRDLDQFEEAAPPETPYNFIRFHATGRFDGEDGWKVRVRVTDTGEPGNGANAGGDSDSIRIQLWNPGGTLVYDSLTDFPAEQQQRHDLDHGNLQIHPADD